MTGINIHNVKKMTIERNYQEDTEAHVLNLRVETERSGVIYISFFADEIGALTLIHKKEGE